MFDIPLIRFMSELYTFYVRIIHFCKFSSYYCNVEMHEVFTRRMLHRKYFSLITGAKSSAKRCNRMHFIFRSTKLCTNQQSIPQWHGVTRNRTTNWNNYAKKRGCSVKGIPSKRYDGEELGKL